MCIFLWLCHSNMSSTLWQTALRCANKLDVSVPNPIYMKKRKLLWTYIDYFLMKSIIRLHGNTEYRVRHSLDHSIPGRWLGKRGPIGWAPRLPDLNPLGYCFGGCLKLQVYIVEIASVTHLQQRNDVCQYITADTPWKIQNIIKFFLQTCLGIGVDILNKFRKELCKWRFSVYGSRLFTSSVVYFGINWN